MLLGQYLGGSHYAGLISVVYGYEHSHKCHHRLTAAHIALQQTVHLAAAAHVVTYLADNAFLRSRQRERISYFGYIMLD
jgi:hypothetical protein